MNLDFVSRAFEQRGLDAAMRKGSLLVIVRRRSCGEMAQPLRR